MNSKELTKEQTFVCQQCFFFFFASSICFFFKKWGDVSLYHVPVIALLAFDSCVIPSSRMNSALVS